MGTLYYVRIYMGPFVTNNPRGASANVIQAPYIFAVVSGTFVILLVVELVLFLIVASLMLAINDKWGKKEPEGLLFMLAMVISGALTSAIYFYYLFDNWTIP